MILALCLLVAITNADLVFFTTSLHYQGNFGNRSVADQLCWNDNVYRGLEAEQTVALVSYTDDLAEDLPTNQTFDGTLKVFSLISIWLADNYPGFWNGQVIDSFASIAEMLGSSLNGFMLWGGQNMDGTLSESNCLDWSSNSTDDYGHLWPLGYDVSCDNEIYIPCLAIYPARRRALWDNKRKKIYFN